VSEQPKTARLLYIDWLRGLAVLCMLEAHVFSAWVRPELKTTLAFRWAQVVAGYAAPLFLFLTGVGMVLAFEAALRKGTPLKDAVRAARSRGLMLFVAAFVFRIQEHVLGGGPVANVFKVDILNCIGLSAMIAATVALPREPGRLAWRALGIALLVFAATPYVARIPWPSWAPWHLTSYITDQRTWFFPLFPWLGYLCAGMFAGTVWARAHSDKTPPHHLHVTSDLRTGNVLMLGTIAFGLALVGASWFLTGQPSPRFIFFGATSRNLPAYAAAHLGWICILAGLFAFAQRWAVPPRFGPVRQLGRTSLLVYWVHVDLVYGHLAGSEALNLKGQLTVQQALVAFVVLTLLMLALSWVRTRYFSAFKPSVVFPRLWREFLAEVRAAGNPGATPGTSFADHGAKAHGRRGDVRGLLQGSLGQDTPHHVPQEQAPIGALVPLQTTGHRGSPAQDEAPGDAASSPNRAMSLKR